MSKDMPRADQVRRMQQHFKTCQHKGSGRFHRSFRLEYVFTTKTTCEIQQIKCAGCGYSLDY